MENANQHELLEPAPLREANAQVDRHDFRAAGRLQLTKRGRIVLLCLALGITSCASAWRGVAPSTSEPASSKMAVDIASPGQTYSEKQLIKLRYISGHPFNLFLRMSAQLIFGLPGETVGRIPVFYSSYELEVALRTVNGSGSTPRNWTDLQSFVARDPSAASMYMAALLTLPRATLVYAWTHDYNGAYKLIRNMEVDIPESANQLTRGWLRTVLQATGMLSDHRDSCTADSDSSPAHETCGRQTVGGKIVLGRRLWPLALLCPGVVTGFVALALLELAPVAAFWVLATSIFRAACELRVLIYAIKLIRQRRPQAAVQCVACSHGVPFMLGCHALVLLRLAAALLPARVFLFLAFHMYGTWAPLAAAAIALMALQPNNAQFIGDAMDGIRHLGHRAAEDLNVAALGVAATASVTVRRRQHWPPPVSVPAELQETAESAPKHLLCPITHHILTEPAVTSTGATYERSAIVEWLAKAGKDPLTGHAVSADEVFPNLAMYSVVEEYVREHMKAHKAAAAAASEAH
ncbi:hypothetical protein Agub_g10450 [Astrephomene gubernaculifera]|uniref:U-box domain-containing protein n=1 Tax=Astrephomene gubernaculifera TaxID=47775 RepID=A0AAD3DV33_9CHLO|nr:hypothetical protein Agub_g10450 [Astrephomene gubernaculifera]